MHRLLPLLEHHGLALIAVALGFAIALWHFRRAEGRTAARLLFVGGLFTFAIGGMTVPEESGMWLAAGAGGVLFIAALVVLISGSWFYPLAILLSLALILGLGAWLEAPASVGIADAVRAAASAEVGIAGLSTVWFFGPAMLALLALSIGLL